MNKGEATREKILHETNELILKKGFGATSLNDVLDASGAKKGTLYYHFASKEELGFVVLNRSIKNFLSELDAILIETEPLQSIRSFFDYALNYHREKKFTGGCLFGNTALEMSDTNKQYADCVSNLFIEWINRLDVVIQAGQQKGEFRSDIPSLSLSQTIVSTIEGGIMLSRLRKEEGPLKNCLQTLFVFITTQK